MDRKVSSTVHLTKAQAERLCRLGVIPPDQRDQFTEAVERCVASYLRVRTRKAPSAVENELKQIEKRVRSCLRLVDAKTRRPGEFRARLEAIRGALHGLSQPAREFLQFRNAKVVHTIPEGWSPTIIADVVIDPICFSSIEDQVGALQDLLGALAGPVANRRRARPRTYSECALYHCLAFAFTRDTGKAASDTSTKFMKVCNEIKLIYELDDWKPESLARSARRLRADEQ